MAVTRNGDKSARLRYPQMRHYLGKLGFRWGRIHRHIRSRRADADIVAWLRAYCLRRVDRMQKKDAGVVDVFIDECWIWRNGGGNYSWYLDDPTWGKVNAPAHKWGIVTCIIRWYNDAGTAEYELYEELLDVWKIDKRSDNLDGAKFEEWFGRVCKVMAENFSGRTVVFHMDNASFHRRKDKQFPNFEDPNMTAMEMANWLVQHTQPGHGLGDWDAFIDDAGALPDIEVLRTLCQEHQAADPVIIKSMAGVYGYKVDFTAPYWPHCQPVEKLWSNLKWDW
jgi:transposase